MKSSRTISSTLSSRKCENWTAGVWWEFTFVFLKKKSGMRRAKIRKLKYLATNKIGPSVGNDRLQLVRLSNQVGQIFFFYQHESFRNLSAKWRLQNIRASNTLGENTPKLMEDCGHSWVLKLIFGSFHHSPIQLKSTEVYRLSLLFLFFISKRGSIIHYTLDLEMFYGWVENEAKTFEHQPFKRYQHVLDSSY